MSKSKFDFISDDEDDDLLKDLDKTLAAKPLSSLSLIPDIFGTASGLPPESTPDDDDDLDSYTSSQLPTPSSLSSPSSPVSLKPVSPTKRRPQTNFLSGTSGVTSSKRLLRSASSTNAPNKRPKRSSTKATKQPSLNDFFGGKPSASGTKQSSLNEFFQKDPASPLLTAKKILKSSKKKKISNFEVSQDTMKLVNSLNALEALEHEDELEREKVRAKVTALRDLEQSTLEALTKRIVSNGFNGGTVPGTQVWPGAEYENISSPSRTKKKPSAAQRRGGGSGVRGTPPQTVDELVAKRFDVARETVRIMYREKTDPGGSDYQTCKDFYLMTPIYVPYKCEPPPSQVFSSSSNTPGASSKSQPWGFLSHASTPHFAVESGKLLRKLKTSLSTDIPPDSTLPVPTTSLPLPLWTWILFSFVSSPQAANDAITSKYTDVLIFGYNVTEWDHVDVLRRVFASVGVSTEFFDEVATFTAHKDDTKDETDDDSDSDSDDRSKPPPEFDLDSLMKPVLGPRYVFPQIQAVKMATQVALGIVEKVAADNGTSQPVLESLQLLVFVLLALVSVDASLLSQISQLDFPSAFTRLLSTVPKDRWSNSTTNTLLNQAHTTKSSCPADLLPFSPTLAPKYKDTFCYTLVNILARVLPPSQVILRSRLLESLSETSSVGRILELRQYLAAAFFTTSTFDTPQGSDDGDSYADPLQFYFDPDDIATTVEYTILPIIFRDPVFANPRAFNLELVTRKAKDPYFLQSQAEGVRNVFESRRAALLSSWRGNTHTLTGLAEIRTRVYILCRYVLHHLVRVAEPHREALIHRLQDLTRTVLQLLRTGPGGAGIKDGHEGDEDEEEDKGDDFEQGNFLENTPNPDVPDESRSVSPSQSVSPLEGSPSRLSEEPEPALAPCVIVRAASESPSPKKSVFSKQPSAVAAAIAFTQARPEVRRKILPAVTTSEVMRVSRRPMFLHEGLSLDVAAGLILQELRDLRPAEDGYSTKLPAGGGAETPVTRSVSVFGYATPSRRGSENGDNAEAEEEEDGKKVMPSKKKVKVVSFDEDTKTHDGKEYPEASSVRKQKGFVKSPSLNMEQVPEQKPVISKPVFNPMAPQTGVRPKRRVIHRRRPEVIQS